MRWFHFLTSLPFWPRTRLNFFTKGVADGQSVAYATGATRSAENEQINEQALFAASALPGRVSAENARNYRLGWIEGYRTVSNTAPGKEASSTEQ